MVHLPAITCWHATPDEGYEGGHTSQHHDDRHAIQEGLRGAVWPR